MTTINSQHRIWNVENRTNAQHQHSLNTNRKKQTILNDTSIKINKNQAGTGAK